MALKAKDLANVRPDVPAAIEEKKGVIRGKKQIITVGLPPEMVIMIDKAAATAELSRAQYIYKACKLALQSKAIK